MGKTLHLNLIRKWFDMVQAKIKKDEYRGITPYWLKRLFYAGAFAEYVAIEEIVAKINKYGYTLSDLYAWAGWIPRDFDTITFSNGYSKNRPQFEIECKGIEIGEGKTEWGAVKGKKYFVIKLGEITNK